METRMSVLITIPEAIDSQELYEEIKQYHADVADIGNTTLVHVTIDIRNDAIEKIIAACNKYSSECKVEAQMLKKKE